ncbi:inner membrane protein import complex subunit Tim54-domain-containing protein [Auriculariales sp. MPI-PUGE-AT-0066]|nr:inner membrane protein import complex subunit Tim54-domain-containing protein [Auriculariales sp. MPI-PUGE-AT-0066]
MSDAPAHSRGARQVMRSLGIPAAVLDFRPRLPSRNWMIFLSVTGSLVGAYAYDRRECRRIKEEYKAKVAHLATVPLATNDFTRKVTVYACKSPDDEDATRSERFFRKYLKPILVAAAVDYEIINGNRYGALALDIADKIRTKRRIAAGIEPEPINLIPLPTQMTPEQKAARELEGGTIIIGRHTWKEFLAGTVAGWSGSVRKVDLEEELSQELHDDGVFDEPDVDELSDGASSGRPFYKPPMHLSPLTQLPFQSQFRPTSNPSPSLTADHPPPDHVPPQPPLLLVPFSNLIGFRNIPRMIVNFFNERERVRIGSAAAYALVQAQTRPFSIPTDLDFDIKQEAEYLSGFETLPESREKTRSEYYQQLAKKLATARELARGKREPTKDEATHPPPTEVELRAERLKKELRWRADVRGWSILHRGSPPQWDHRLDTSFKVFELPSSSLGSEER